MHEEGGGENSVMETLAFILPIIAAGSLVFLFGITLYFKIRRTLPVRVNCWFCNKDTQVPYGNQNCWDCPSCEQYNGFLPDGSYNKAIPAQHDELLNHPVHAVPNKQSLPAEGKGNGLCRKCNINQELKVQQLAAFSPVNPARYDEEVDEFKRHLERNYRLCSQCEKVLKQTLHKQKSWLLGLRMQQIHSGDGGVLNKKGAAAVMRSLKQFSTAVADWGHGISSILAAWLTLSSAFHLSSGKLPIPAAISQSSIWLAIPGSETLFPKLIKLLPLATVYETYITAFSATVLLFVLFSKKRARVDMLCTFLWTILCAQSWLKKWEKLEAYISLKHFIKIYLVVSSLNLILCLCALLVPHQRKKMKVNRSINSSPNCSDSSFNISNISEYEFVPEDSIATEKIQKQEEPVKVMEENIPKQHTLFRQPCDSYDTPLPSDNSSCSEDCTPISTPLKTESESPLDINLDSLVLDDYNEKNKKKTHSGLFQTKVYGQNNSIDLFTSTLSKENSAEQRSRKMPLLRPPQLNVQNHVTQSSWVAGGYWQSPKHNISPIAVPDTVLPTCFNSSPLSRSSSQSSGFVSQSSQHGPYERVATSLPNSRNSSLCGAEFDRFSALSEPAYHYPTTTSPFFCAPQRPGMVHRPCYRPAPTYLPGGLGMMPPSPPMMTGFCSPFTPQPILQPSYYYPLFTPITTPPLSPIWNPAAFTSQHFKQPPKISPKAASEARSHFSSQKSSISHEGSSITKPHTPVSHKSQMLPGALKENLFLTVCFYSSVILSAFVAMCAALMNTKLSLTGLI